MGARRRWARVRSEKLMNYTKPVPSHPLPPSPPPPPPHRIRRRMWRDAVGAEASLRVRPQLYETTSQPANESAKGHLAA
eukprot:534167-Pyramimonas_sp.AAC.1